jgi:hypothetical protein
VRSEASGRTLEKLRPLDAGQASSDPARRERMRSALRKFRSELEIPDAVEQELSGQDREILRQLGYLE